LVPLALDFRAVRADFLPGCRVIGCGLKRRVVVWGADETRQKDLKNVTVAVGRRSGNRCGRGNQVIVAFLPA
jgi:hypothetical protein